MDPLSTLPQPGQVRAVPPVVAAGGRAASEPAPGSVPEPVAPPSSRVGVEYSHRSDGLQQMTFIDMRTGVVISQTPPPQVLAVVDSIVAAIRQREA